MTWVRAHPVWTVLIVLAILMIAYTLYNVGGGTEDIVEIQSPELG